MTVAGGIVPESAFSARMGRIASTLTDDPPDEPSPATAGSGDRGAKIQRVRAILDERGADSIRLTSVEMLSWLLDGARVHVASNGAAVLAAEITRTHERIVCSSNETERLLAEQLPAGVTIEDVPWHTAPSSALGARDHERHLAERDVTDELRAARAALLPGELARYRQLCAGTAAALTDTLAGASPSDSEFAVAADVAARVTAVGAEPLVVLVGGDTRQRHRHPLPTAAKIGECVMAVVCARQHGMIANLTRWRCFTQRVHAAHTDAASRLRGVEAEIFGATRAGAALSSVFDVAKRAYAEHGFAADEWTRHHQGGPTGYLGRDPKATDRTHDTVVANQAFAWNPSAPGAKVEDTVLTTSDPDRPLDVLTVDPRWPTVQVDGLARPELLHD